VNLARMWDEAERLQLWMGHLLVWLAEGDVVPVIDRIFPAAEAGAAQLRLQRRENVGKVLLDFRDGSGS
jgi:NADPH:quinone reductase-like Zn-dependent oxidoreductase